MQNDRLTCPLIIDVVTFTHHVCGLGCNKTRKKKPEKNSPKFEVCCSIRFFRYQPPSPNRLSILDPKSAFEDLMESVMRGSTCQIYISKSNEKSVTMLQHYVKAGEEMTQLGLNLIRVPIFMGLCFKICTFCKYLELKSFKSGLHDYFSS